MKMLHTMPLFWCAVLFLLFLAYLYAEIAISSAAWPSIAALALSIAGTPPWMQTLCLACGWLCIRLIRFVCNKNHPTAQSTRSGDFYV